MTSFMRKYAAACPAVAQRRWKHGITEDAAIEEGLKQKATEFNEAGAEIYAKM